MEPVAMLRSQLSVPLIGQFQDGAEDTFSSLLTFNFQFLILMLLHALYERLFTAPLNRYSVAVLWRLRIYRDIIIIIIAQLKIDQICVG